MHILLLVNSYVTEKDPRRGAKFRLQLEGYRDYGMKVGLVSVLQRDYSIWECLAEKSFLISRREHASPIVCDCTFYAALRWIPLRSVRSFSLQLSTRAVKKYIRRYGKPDLVHAHGSQWAGVVARAVKRRFGIPYVVTEHMSNYVRNAVDEKDMPVLHDVFKSAAMRITVSRQLGNKLETLFGNDFRPWSYVPNMVDRKLFDRDVSKPKGEGVVFLAIGTLNEKKGYDLLLKAYAKAFSDDSVRLRIGGDGPQRDVLKNLSLSLGVEDRVDFLGPLSREDVAQEMAACSAYVVSSHYETFGIPVVEALACGKPVLSTKCGGPEELVNESNGVLVEPGSVDSLANGMREVVRRLGDFDGQSIASSARSEFSPEAVIGRLESVYKSVV